MSFSSAFSTAFDLDGVVPVITDPPCQHATVQTDRVQYSVVQTGRSQLSTVQTGRLYHGSIVIEHCSPEPGEAPVNTSPPTISGSTTVPSLMTVTDNGTWAADPAVTNYSYQWYRYATPIAGATASTYTTQVGQDENTRISVVVTAHNTAGSGTAESNSILVGDDGAQAARYWRVRGLTCNNTGFIGMANLEMHTTVGGADITTTGQAISGSHNATNTADKAFDADETGTWWNTAKSNIPDGSWVGQDFGSATIVREIKITAMIDGNNYDQTPDSFEIEYSNNMTLWISSTSVDRGPNSWSSGEEATYAAQAATVAAQNKEPVMAIPSLSLDINQHDDKRFVFDIQDDLGDPLPIADLDDIIFAISDAITVEPILEFTMSGNTVKVTGDSQVTVDVNDLQSGTILGPGSFYCEMRVHIAGAPTIYQTVGAGSFSVIDTMIGDYT